MHHPGGGRGPIGKVGVTDARAQLQTFPSWAPAFAGVASIEAGGDEQGGSARYRDAICMPGLRNHCAMTSPAPWRTKQAPPLVRYWRHIAFAAERLNPPTERR